MEYDKIIHWYFVACFAFYLITLFTCLSVLKKLEGDFEDEVKSIKHDSEFKIELANSRVKSLKKVIEELESNNRYLEDKIRKIQE